MSATRPSTSSGVRGFALEPLPEYDNKKKATTRKTRPGRAERCTCFGGAGLPDRAATIGILVTVWAGRAAARDVATTASTIATATTTHGSANAPITWWALDSIRGR
jgi:hypothetical protein